MVSGTAATPQCRRRTLVGLKPGPTGIRRRSGFSRTIVRMNADPRARAASATSALTAVQRKKSSFSAPNMDAPQLRPNLPTLFATWVRPALMSSHALLIGWFLKTPCAPE